MTFSKPSLASSSQHAGETHQPGDFIIHERLFLIFFIKETADMTDDMERTNNTEVKALDEAPEASFWSSKVMNFLL